jgi:hypothetical protein
MIALREFLRNDLANQGRGPDAGVQAVSDRAAIQNVTELLALSLGEASGSAAAVTFPEPFLGISVPVVNPQRYRAAMHAQVSGDLTGPVTVQAQEDALDAQEQVRGFFPLRFAANLEQLGDRPAIPFGKYRAHICPRSILDPASMSNYLCAAI